MTSNCLSGIKGIIGHEALKKIPNNINNQSELLAAIDKLQISIPQFNNINVF